MGGSAAGTAGLLGALVSRPGLGEDVGFPVVWPDMGGANPPSTSNRFIAVLLSVLLVEVSSHILSGTRDTRKCWELGIIQGSG